MAKMIWKIVLVTGVTGVLLGLAVTGTLIAQLLMTEETVGLGPSTATGIIAGILILIVSFLMLAAGLVFVIKNRKSYKA
ncbi:MAG: hypothetical protein KF855_04235 [Acidobacteria bacterium]|nr:hypothetical protein [Acidobacteriota bacterium]